MKYAIFWKYTPESGQRVLVGHPGSYADTVEECKDEGRKQLAEVKKEPLVPICVGQIDEAHVDDILNMDEHYLGDDEVLFLDVTDSDIWSEAPWWPKA